MKIKVSKATSLKMLCFCTASLITSVGYMAYEKYYLGNDIQAEGRESLSTSSIIYGKNVKEKEEDKKIPQGDLYKPRQ